MAAELQSLLDRIQAEGVDKANEKAKAIIEQAEKTSSAKLAATEKKCAERLAQAKTEAELLHGRAEQAVRQAARDVVIEVRQAVQQTLERVLRRNLHETLSGDFLQTFLADIVKAMAKQPEAVGGMEVLVSPSQAQQLATFAADTLACEAAGSVQIAPDKGVAAGIRVMLADGRVEHDFTDEAIMAAMTKMMSPHLAKMIFNQP